jgi:hypothetical protein
MAEAPGDDNLGACSVSAGVAIDKPLDIIPIYVHKCPSSLTPRERTHEAPRGGASRERESRRCGFPSIGADIGESRHRLVERREAPGPTSLGSRASKRRVWATRLCRRRAADRVMVRQGGLANPLAPPGAPSPRSRDGKKGQGESGALKKIKATGPRSVGYKDFRRTPGL